MGGRYEDMGSPREHVQDNHDWTSSRPDWTQSIVHLKPTSKVSYYSPCKY